MRSVTVMILHGILTSCLTADFQPVFPYPTPYYFFEYPREVTYAQRFIFYLIYGPMYCRGIQDIQPHLRSFKKSDYERFKFGST